MLGLLNERARNGEEPGDIDITASDVLSRNGGLENSDKELAQALLHYYLAAQPLED